MGWWSGRNLQYKTRFWYSLEWQCLVRSVAGIEIIGPIIMGLKKPVHVLQLGASVREIVDMVAIAVVDAQMGH